jgi:hypothetical protein
MKRRRPPVDLRPNWRDPSMPALFSVTNRNTGKESLMEFTPEAATRAFAAKLQREAPHLPDWKSDPTYDLKGRRR